MEQSVLSRIIVSILFVACVAHAEDNSDEQPSGSSCDPTIGMFRADDPTKEYAQLDFGHNKYRRYFTGRIADHGKNQKQFNEWFDKLMEKECSPSKS